MFDRQLLFFGLLCLGATLAQAQPSPRRPMPEACQTSSAYALPELEKRRQTLERDISRQTTEVERVSKIKDGKAGGSGADARTKDLRENLRLRQEDLLEVLFRIECVRAAGEMPEPPSRAPFKRPGPAKDALEVTTYYATNRKQTGGTEPAKFYEGVFEPTLHYGRAVVSIPPTHTPGKLAGDITTATVVTKAASQPACLFWTPSSRSIISSARSSASALISGAGLCSSVASSLIGPPK